MKLKSTSTVKNIDGGDSSCVLWHNNTLFTGNDNGVIKAWSIKGDNVELVAETKVHDYPVYHMVSDSKTNQLISCSSDMKIIYWTNSDGKLTQVKVLEGNHKDAIRKLCLQEDYLYSGDESGEVIVWTPDGHFLSQFNVNLNEEIWDLAVVNTTLATVRDRDLVISEMRRKEEKVSVSTKMTIRGRSPLFLNAKFVCFGESAGKDILVHKNEAGFPCIGKLEGHSMIINAITGSGNFLYSGGWDKKVIAWNLDTCKRVGEVEVDHYINALALDSSGSNLFASGQAGTVSMIELKD